MKAASANLSPLQSVLDDSRSYRIPPYQRRYTWELARVEELWEDVVEMYKDPDRKKDEYLLGSIVTVSKKGGVEDVVDGQQRLVSLTLMFCALRDSLNHYLSKADGDLKSEIRSMIKIINDRIRDGHDTFIELNNLEDSRLLAAICRENKTDEELKSLKSQAGKALHQNYDELSRCAGYLCEQIGILKPDLSGVEKLNEIIKAVTSRVFVVDINVKNENDAQQIFQALNSTGQSLTEADLIKNHLILKNQGGQSVDGEWKKAFAPFAKKIRSNPKKSDSYIYDSLLSRNYQIIKAGTIKDGKRVFASKDVGKRELYKAVKDKLELDKNYTVMDFIDDLRIDMEIIKVLENPQLNDHTLNHMLYGLKQIHAVYFRRPIIAAVRKWGWESDKTRSLIEFLLKFFFMYRTVCKMDIDKIRSIARDLTKELKLHNPGEIVNFYKIILNKIPNLKEFHDQFHDKFVKQEYTRDATKYILISIECDLQKEFEVQTKFDIEHVFPQKHKPKAWPNHTELEQYLDNIGNLTLLPSKWNRALQNYNFDVKKTGVKGKDDIVTLPGKSGVVNGKQIKISYETSSLELNKYFKACDKWGKEELLKRQEVLQEHAKKIWNLEKYVDQTKS